MTYRSRDETPYVRKQVRRKSLARRITGKRPRWSGNTWTLLVILALLSVAVWIMTPSGSTALDRETTNLGMRLGLDLQGGVHLLYQADLTNITDPKGVMEGTRDVIERRVNVLGVSEPTIQIQGDDRILVQLAGLTNITEAVDLIGQTALLEFRKQDDEGNWIPTTGTYDGQELALTSRYFRENTWIELDQMTNKPILHFEWDAVGSVLSEQITSELIGEPLGIYLGNEPLLGEDGEPIAPIVRDVIKDRGVIEGLSLNEARQLSNLLNAGRIPVELTPIFQKTVSATLGADFVDKAVKAGLIALGIVMLFMLLCYRLPGAVASLALLIYIAFVLAIFKLIPVTLTLAGLAGFVLSIGMAVDANVLIFERMKEELRGGRTLRAAAETGFNRAWVAIRDSNFSTIIICGVLFWFGSSIADSPTVKGFAVTLFFGVVLSMFSAIVVTRTFLRFSTGPWGSRRLKWFGVEAKNV
ncbi:MAG: protein translocase subunit SecD [Chloroflexi bacterium]|nr:protein translocase subunit SecD [Chloroflexota bacterium]